jgi:transaldolase
MIRTTRAISELGQSIWLDNITRTLLATGTLRRYLDEYDVVGLTSNPTIYDRAIGASSAYDAQIAAAAASGASSEDTFFELALDDLREAADLFRPIYDHSGGDDGFVSLEVSPLLAFDAEATTAEAKRLAALGSRPNLFIKIPGTTEGLTAIEDVIFAGIPVNVTLLFSPEQYLAAADAYTRGIERRVEAGLAPLVASVASLFVSRWDAFTAADLPEELRNELGLAIGRHTFGEYCRFISSERWQRLLAVGARPQRLLFASTGTKDPAASPTRYVVGLAASETIDTMPEETLLAAGRSTEPVRPLEVDLTASAAALARFTAAGLDLDETAMALQQNGATAFVTSWTSLLDRIAQKAGTTAADIREA